MSAFPPVPKGHVFFAFELCPTDGFRYLTAVPATPGGRKVKMRARVQPLRRTRGAHRLIIYCVPCQDGGSHALRAMATEISAHHAAMCAQPPDGGQAWYEPNPGGTLDLIPHFVVEYRPAVLRGAMGI